MIVLVHPSVPAKSIPELIALTKKMHGKFNYASAGVGSGIHLGAELFAHMAGVKMAHVPYKGTGPALTDLLGGHVSMYFSSLPSAIGLVKEGKVRALAVTGAKRSDVFPDMPTVAETACPASRRCCATASWRRPARRGRSSTSSTRRCAQALADPDTIERMATRRHRAVAVTPEEYAAEIDREETQVVGGGEALGRGGGEVARHDPGSIPSACAPRKSVSESRPWTPKSTARARARRRGSTISTICCAGTASRNSATCRTPATRC